MRTAVIVVILSMLAVTVRAPTDVTNANGGPPATGADADPTSQYAESSHSGERVKHKQISTPTRVVVEDRFHRLQWFFIRIWGWFVGVIHYWQGVGASIVGHAGLWVDSLSHYAVQGRIAKSMAQVRREGTPLEELVKAFAEGAHSDFVKWIPKSFLIPDMKILHNKVCMYGMEGSVADFSTIELVGTGIEFDNNPYDHRINVIIKYKLKTMTLSYGRSQTTPKVQGQIRFDVQENEVQFGWDIPSIGTMPISFFKPKCLVVLRSFSVNDMKNPIVNIATSSAMASTAKSSAKMLWGAKEYKFGNIVRAGAVKEFLKHLESEDTETHSWICKSKMFEESLQEAEQVVETQSGSVPTADFCKEKSRGTAKPAPK